MGSPASSPKREEEYLTTVDPLLCGYGILDDDDEPDGEGVGRRAGELTERGWEWGTRERGVGSYSSVDCESGL